jgi:hypothetical protein
MRPFRCHDRVTRDHAVAARSASRSAAGFRRFAVTLSVLCGVLLAAGDAFAGRISLAWDPSPDPVSGYTVYWGTSSGVYTAQVNTTQTSHTIEGLTNGVRYYIVVRAFSSGGQSAPSNEVNGIPSNAAPSITNPGPRTIKTGPFTLTVTASDPDGDVLTYSATGLPSGLSINPSSGTISGTVAAGTYNITVTANDGALQASTTFTLTVTPNTAPTLQTPANQSHDTDDVVSLQLAGADADGDVLTFSATGLPPGLTVAAATGAITGTPTTVGVYTVTATVSDGALPVSVTFTWTIVPLAPAVPISRWMFDEGTGVSAADAHGSRTGTLTNGAGWTTGRSGQAVLLDGVNDYVALPTFDVTGSALTLAAWVRAGSVATTDQRFISKTTGTTNYWTLGTNGSAFRFRLRTGTSTTTLDGGTLPLTTWSHVVATYDGTTMRLFVNGVQQVGTAAKSGALATSATAPVSIGRNPTGTAGANYFNGAIDDVRMFARALTAAEVTALYNEPVVPPLSFTDDPLVPGVHAMRLVHITELRARIGTLRLGRGLGAAAWTPLIAGSTVIRASHITELRAALAAVYAAAGRVSPAYTDGTLTPGMPIKAAHLSELRAAVRALE